jgi:6-phosphogluconolactonase (cycloisomerase 2 family)
MRLEVGDSAALGHLDWNARVPTTPTGSRLLPLACFACFSLGLFSCGGSEAPTSLQKETPFPQGHPAFLHVYARATGEIATFAIGVGDGRLSPVTGSPVTIAAGLTSLSVSPTGRFVAGVGPRQIAVYEVSTTGQLQAVPGSPFATDWASVSLAYHPSGRQAYVVRKDVHPVLSPCYGPGSILTFDVDSQTGALTRRSASVATGTVGSRLAIVRSGVFGFVGCAGDDSQLYGPCPQGGLNGYSIGSDGNLAPLAPSAYAGWPSRNTLAMGDLLFLTSCSAPAAYTRCSSQDGFVYTFRIDAVGGLSLAGTVSLDGYAEQVVADPLGQYLFAVASSVTEGADISRVSVVRIEADGESSVVSRTMLTSGETAALAVDPEGRYLYASLERVRSLGSWRINRTTGALEPLPQTAIALEGTPSALAISQRQE